MVELFSTILTMPIRTTRDVIQHKCMYAQSPSKAVNPVRFDLVGEFKKNTDQLFLSLFPFFKGFKVLKAEIVCTRY
jgi:hypothetical protein